MGKFLANLLKTVKEAKEITRQISKEYDSFKGRD